jgi:hypothetical protein
MGSMMQHVSDASLQLLLQHLHHNNRAATPESKPSIDYAAFEEKLKSWRESTSTSPSGLHLGHYKALLTRHNFRISQTQTPDAPH